MSAFSKANPFAQSPEYWKVVFMLPSVAVGTAEEAFNDMALAVSSFETDEENHIWTFDILCAEPPDMAEVSRRLMVLSAVHHIVMPRPEVTQIMAQDWLSKVARDFPPMQIGRFYVHGAHVKDTPTPGSISIQVEAGAAFGSGEHATTSCCLKALDMLAKRRDFSRILDMGCGSGILAIAAAKLWKQPVLAVDLDDVAVKVTKENARINRVSRYVDAAVSDGYFAACVARHAPYDLILSNILARPLVAFAPSLAKNLTPGGVAILSGLLTSQETMVRSAHALQGLKLHKRFVSGEWCTLVLKS